MNDFNNSLTTAHFVSLFSYFEINFICNFLAYLKQGHVISFSLIKLNCEEKRIVQKPIYGP